MFGDEDPEDEDDKAEAKPMLDYRQYYPTVLPLRPPGHEAREDEQTQADSAAPNLEHGLVR